LLLLLSVAMSRASCSSSAVFSRLPNALRMFHGMHRASLVSMLATSESASTVAAVVSLGEELGQFCAHLDMHHRIEDQSIFPAFAKKMDISHLEAHHHQLEELLATCIKHAKSLRKIEEFSHWERGRTVAQLQALQKLVNEHEDAEEAVVSVENIKKHFTQMEAARLMG
jgi:iron-sulfur cluster repair protein YtfE (RIC family)